MKKRVSPGTIRSRLFWVLLLAVFYSCQAQQNGTAPSVKEVSAREFHQRLQSAKGPLIDVRTPEEYKQGHIRDAQLVDYHGEHFREGLLEFNKADTVFIYCRSGNRSRKAGDMMLGMGFTNIVHLKNGLIEWQQAGLPVEK